MKNRSIFLIAIIYFSVLIIFEAWQQHFYIYRFQLQGNNEVTVMDLMVRHAFRWIIWTILAIPLAVYVIKKPARQLNSIRIVYFGIGLAATLAVTLIAISYAEFFSQPFDINLFKDAFAFFAFQKSALFVNAYLGLILLINGYQNIKLLESKIVELSDLKSEYRSMYDELSNRIKDDTTLIQIKIGNKTKNLLLSEVIWVQSDDYCVRIHSGEKSYNLRKSMKLIEKELEPKGFVRLHRNSIVNKEHVDSISYGPKPYVLLRNGQKLVIASGRVSKVRESFKGLLDR